MATVNPGIYFRELMPHYAKTAKLCELVYSNIDQLFSLKHEGGDTVASFITLGGDYRIIRCRCLLGYYKPTIGGDRDDIINSYNDFIKLMKDHGLQHDFSMTELSDAEHFYASAVITMVPVIGLAANPIGNVFWDFVKPGLSAINNNVRETLKLNEEWSTLPSRISSDMRYDVDQLTGPDLAGHHYGLYITYVNRPAENWHKAKNIWNSL